MERDAPPSPRPTPSSPSSTRGRLKPHERCSEETGGRSAPWAARAALYGIVMALNAAMFVGLLVMTDAAKLARTTDPQTTTDAASTFDRRCRVTAGPADAR